MPEKILEVKNLKKSFGNTEVLRGIDFSMNRGEVLVIIGSSGSGKTTLARKIYNSLGSENAVLIGMDSY